LRLCSHAWKGADGFVGVAAVADYRPEHIAGDKIKKSGQPLTLQLVENPDILATVARCRPKPFVVGFAAETRNLEQSARGKLEAKGADLIAANRVGRNRNWVRYRGQCPGSVRELTDTGISAVGTSAPWPASWWRSSPNK
jgi:phosphopantothenoylcysteine synthetase/decarboxylase